MRLLGAACCGPSRRARLNALAGGASVVSEVISNRTGAVESYAVHPFERFEGGRHIENSIRPAVCGGAARCAAGPLPAGGFASNRGASAVGPEPRRDTHLYLGRAQVPLRGPARLSSIP